MLTNKENKAQLARVSAALATIFHPRPAVRPSEWAEAHRKLSPEANAKGYGRWHNYPMQVQPLDDAVDPRVQTTCLMWASQTAGKTEILLNLVGYFIDYEPSTILMVQPDLVIAEAYMGERIDPMIRDTPILNLLVNKRGSGNKTLKKSWPGGYMVAAGANSPSSLASRPIRVNLFDEVDRYPASAGREGDPVDLAERRSDTYPNAVIVKTSTPTIRHHSRIEKEFGLSDMNYWFVKCPYCGTEQTLKWRQLKWPAEDRLEETAYECELKSCAARWNDRERVAAVRGGRWIATAPFKGRRGYHLSGIYSLMLPKKGFRTRMEQMAAEFLAAKRKGKDSLKVWTNTFLAETFEEAKDVKPNWKLLYERREPYVPAEKIPQGVRLITAGVDFQEDRFELEFVGHGYGEETWGLGHRVVYGDPRKPELYSRLDATLSAVFRREDGATLRVDAAGFDSGYAPSQRQLYAYLRPRLGRRYYPFKGSSIRNSEPIAHSSKRNPRDPIKLILVGTNRIKTYIYNRATVLEPGPGYLHFPEEYTEEWFRQLLVEDWKDVYEAGHLFRVYTMPEVQAEGSTNRNEALDLRVYAQAALYARGVPNWEFEERKNLRTIGETDLNENNRAIVRTLKANAPPAASAPRRHAPRRRGGLLAGLF